MGSVKGHSNIFLVIVLIALSLGCSTEKDAALNVGYHNMTARYNGYFNAGEIINQSIQSYREGVKDDYSKLLELQVYPKEADATSVFPDMDLAIEKCSKVIYRHSMPNPNVVSTKDEEHCRWIDDNWFLIGKSYFLKREFDQAEEKFRYIKSEYENESSMYAAEIWLAKLYIQKGDLSQARLELLKVKKQMEDYDSNQTSILDQFKKDGKSSKKKSKYQRKKEKRARKRNKEKETKIAKFTDKLKVDYEVTMADLYIKEEDYKKAAEHLIKAADLTRNRKERARYHYVLGQLYQEMQNPRVAEGYFQKVIKSNAVYEMRFYAKINKVLSATGGRTELREDLHKMLKDAKNDEYKDQIYYVLAELDLKDGNRPEAIVNLTKSARYSVSNDKQKAKTYLKLADMHFEDRLYIKSQKYYDSCVNVMSKEDEKYDLIENKAKSLFELVENYETYVKEDSLQQLVKLSPKEREKELKRILKQIKEDERQRKADEEARLLAQQKRVNSVSNTSGNGAKWYFYNQKSMAKGYNDFKLWWANRPLEDDWRRATKNTISEFSEVSGDSAVVEVDSLTVDLLREGLPLEEDQLKQSKDNLTNALYNLGMIYKNQLSEEGEAIDYFTQIIDRDYPHEKVLPARYQLYLIFQKNGDKAKTERYKNGILAEHPDSDIAKLIKDPNYFAKKEAMERKDLEAYKIVLTDYNYKRYSDVITACNKVIFNNPTNKYINKYYLLKANAISKIGLSGPEAVKEPLETLYELSPDSEEGRTAKAYLDKMNGESDTGKNNQPRFKFNTSEKQYFAVMIPVDKESKINDAKNKISNFNSSYFAPDELSLTTTILGEEYTILLVKAFDNVVKASAYNKAFQSTPAKSLLNNTADEFESFILSKSNYPILFSSKDIEGYREFYEENY